MALFTTNSITSPAANEFVQLVSVDVVDFWTLESVGHVPPLHRLVVDGKPAYVERFTSITIEPV